MKVEFEKLVKRVSHKTGFEKTVVKSALNEFMPSDFSFENSFPSSAGNRQEIRECARDLLSNSAVANGFPKLSAYYFQNNI